MGLSNSRRIQNGFADYNDVTTAGTPITLVSNTWTKLTNDGAGPNTNLSYLPTGVTSMLNTGTGDIDLSEFAKGDTFEVRPDFTVTPSTNNQTLDLRLTLGTGGGAYTLHVPARDLTQGSGQPDRQAGFAISVYGGDDNTLDNPIGIEVRTSGAGSVVNAGVAILVTKRG